MQGTVQEMRQEAQRERTEAVYRYRRYLTHRKQQVNVILIFRSALEAAAD